MEKMKIKNNEVMRPGWDEYFIEIARIVATRSTCLRRQVGAVLVKDKRILSTGYNGAACGAKHCKDVGCLRENVSVPSGKNHEMCRGLHAEMNAILFAKGSLNGATLYCINKPCVLCAKMLIQVGISKIVFIEDYPDKLADEIFREHGVELNRIQKSESRI